MIVLLLAVLVAVPTPQPTDLWQQIGPSGLTVELLAEYKRAAETPRIVLKAQSRTSHRVERWRPLVAEWFPSQVDAAMRVLACESHGKRWAFNRTSGASGLFQHLAKYWDARAAKAGWAGASVWDPVANVAVAAWLWRQSGWQPWECKP